MTEDTIKPEKTFDFNQVGKRLPYTIPDGFFEQMEETVKQELLPQDRKRHVMAAVIRRCVAVAAVAALIFAIGPSVLKPNKVEMEDVEAAFLQLDDGDRQLLLSNYQSDYFLEEPFNN